MLSRTVFGLTAALYTKPTPARYGLINGDHLVYHTLEHATLRAGFPVGDVAVDH